MEKLQGYLVFDDSKSALVVYAKENEAEGYEVARLIYYGIDKNKVLEILEEVTRVIDLEGDHFTNVIEKHAKKFN